ncbi:hypothetical protein MKX01_027600 [Papaver californicum]|nr:hypothetical protein MKX01_027600 [Papaver californicum]
MDLYKNLKAILKIQKFRRVISYIGFYCFVSFLTYAYTSNTTRAGVPRVNQFYASYHAGQGQVSPDSDMVYIILAARNRSTSSNLKSILDWESLHFAISLLRLADYMDFFVANQYFSGVLDIIVPLADDGDGVPYKKLIQGHKKATTNVL